MLRQYTRADENALRRELQEGRRQAIVRYEQSGADPATNPRSTRGRDTRTTTQRGLGYPHQKDKRRLLRELRPAQPCPRCGHPMWPHQALDRGHTVSRALGGVNSPGRLEHASCNRSAGAALSTPLRLARLRALVQRTIPVPSRDW